MEHVQARASKDTAALSQLCDLGVCDSALIRRFGVQRCPQLRFGPEHLAAHPKWGEN